MDAAHLKVKDLNLCLQQAVRGSPFVRPIEKEVKATMYNFFLMQALKVPNVHATHRLKFTLRNFEKAFPESLLQDWEAKLIYIQDPVLLSRHFMSFRASGALVVPSEIHWRTCWSNGLWFKGTVNSLESQLAFARIHNNVGVRKVGS